MVGRDRGDKIKSYTPIFIKRVGWGRMSRRKEYEREGLCLTCFRLWWYTFLFLVLIGLAIGVLFLSSFIGWSVQWHHFNQTGSILSQGYGEIFSRPLVANSGEIFLCFFYGVVILGGGLFLIGLGIRCCCCRPSLSTTEEELLPLI
jgi:hypothetical protein